MKSKPAAIMGKLFNSAKPKHGEKIETHYATAIPIGTALAQSWNLKLIEKCGRNFKYYSEDPLITGKVASAITKGVQKHGGCGVAIKHFCVNNQEYNRCYSYKKAIGDKCYQADQGDKIPDLKERLENLFTLWYNR